VKRSDAARIALFLVPLAAAIALRIARAFATHYVLDWDETYYMSLAVTGASGAGLYPYIYGFGPMHMMGGIGYAAWSYVAAVKLFGPTIFALRAVSIVVSIAGLAAIWVLLRTWYGTAAAWIGAALTASLRLFALSNTARMDAWTFAWVAWALAAAAVAFDRWPQKRWHVIAGLLFGLGPQVHIDTLATAAGCGVLYLFRYARDAYEDRRVWIRGHPMFLFTAGLAVGLAIYVVLNILPDTASYYTMTVRVRVDATKAYSAGTTSLFASFLNPRIILAKEVVRYRQLWSITPPFEALLLAAGLAACVIRRTAADRLVLILVPFVCISAAILLNNASPLYYIHVMPALVIPLGPLFSNGRGQETVTLANLGRARLAIAAIVVWAVTASTGASTLRALRYIPPAASISSEHIQQVRADVDRRCVIAGDGALYVSDFADYPWFISTRPTEVTLALLYHNAPSEADYWRIKQPDAVFATGPLSAGLADYVAWRGLKKVAPGLWINPGGCRSGP
jgi:Dolichyl-phosphate-mannose-protein mannosyltransferase